MKSRNIFTVRSTAAVLAVVSIFTIAMGLVCFASSSAMAQLRHEDRSYIPRVKCEPNCGSESERNAKPDDEDSLGFRQSLPESMLIKAGFEHERQQKASRIRNETQLAAAKEPVSDGMVSIPAGNFLFGDDKKPVDLPAFKIDKTEVTVAAYKKCVQAGRCNERTTGDACTYGVVGKENHPINCTDWDQAKTYCEWAGKRLPTDQEWEKAARGTDGRTYPWGETDIGKGGKLANALDVSAMAEFSDRTVIPEYDDMFPETAPVCSFPAGNSPYGVCDMAGNVTEWTSDWYDSSKKGRATRGGSWTDADAKAFQSSARESLAPTIRLASTGFRCVQ